MSLVPTSWYGPSTQAHFSRLMQNGSTRMEAMSVACAAKYGTAEYFSIHRLERDKANWTEAYLEVCQALGVDEPGKTTLVVGVNDGMDVEMFRHCRVIGVDPCLDALEIARARPKFRHHQFYNVVAEAMPMVADGSVDTYISLRVYNCSTVILEEAIRELDRVLKPGGAVIISIANGYFEGEKFVEGVFVDGRVDTRRAQAIKGRTMALLSAVGIGLTIRENILESFIFGRKSTSSI